MRSLETQFATLLDLLRESVSINDAVGKHAEMLAVKKAPPPDGHFSMLHAEITADTLLKKRRTSLTRVFQQNGIAGIQFSGNQVVGPSKIGDALRYIVETETFTPASLPGALSDNERLVLARRMVLAGFLTHA